MLSKPLLFVCDDADSFRSRKLASDLGLNPAGINAVNLMAMPPEHLVLWADATGLALGRAGAGKGAATRVNFSDPALQYRLRTSGKRQGLGKAMGLDKAGNRQLHVLDATAGLGRDALLLAHLGCRVTLLEESPLVHALLEDGLYQAQHADDEQLRATVARMSLLHADARSWCANAAQDPALQPDVIYLDPMFPVRSKSAKVKKDIALLHELLGAERDLGSLLAAALAAAKYRVVLKRPDGKLPAELPEPAFVVAGKTAGFAVYAKSSLSNMP